MAVSNRLVRLLHKSTDTPRSAHCNIYKAVKQRNLSRHVQRARNLRRSKLV